MLVAAAMANGVLASGPVGLAAGMAIGTAALGAKAVADAAKATPVIGGIIRNGAAKAASIIRRIGLMATAKKWYEKLKGLAGSIIHRIQSIPSGILHAARRIGGMVVNTAKAVAGAVHWAATKAYSVLRRAWSAARSLAHRIFHGRKKVTGFNAVRRRLHKLHPWPAPVAPQPFPKRVKSGLDAFMAGIKHLSPDKAARVARYTVKTVQDLSTLMGRAGSLAAWVKRVYEEKGPEALPWAVQEAISKLQPYINQTIADGSVVASELGLIPSPYTTTQPKPQPSTSELQQVITPIMQLMPVVVVIGFVKTLPHMIR